ncbi:hypothetical protein HMPREF0322_00689 [Desulfitobacterium hafniense DP7]|uniref:Uncharacterized protein n=1 Tax=Desulfitobacterium hafniense DP7 TaxID=537010 RepID=G9XIB3_DESHA|nr:hypothetical protein HMPREF0322_00689 [Desulfitobacterium hafniense DP7]
MSYRSFHTRNICKKHAKRGQVHNPLSIRLFQPFAPGAPGLIMSQYSKGFS